MSQKRDRYDENAPGPFYVEKDMCIICMAPEAAAPELMGFFEDTSGSHRRSHCYFQRQPSTAEEVDHALEAIRVACCGALRYAGEDPLILARLRETGHNRQCDKG
jgi:hypothetical protein